MNDLISRQDAIEALTEVNLKKHMDSVQDGGQINRSAIRIIMEIPTADVVEVVRCRDCKHRPIIIEEEEIDGFSYEFPDHKCPCRCEDGLFSSNPDDDWFCANGERG